MADEFDTLMSKMEGLVAQPPFESAQNEICDAVAAQVAASFRDRVTPDGEPWEPLKQPSRATGETELAAIAAAQNGAVTAQGYRSEALAGPVWEIQNFGSPQMRVPARPFWYAGKQTLATVAGILRRTFARALQ